MRRSDGAAFLLPLLAWLLHLGCSTTDGEGSETHVVRCKSDVECGDAGPNARCVAGQCVVPPSTRNDAATEADAATDRDGGTCEMKVTPCSGTPDWATLLEARNFGDGAHFTSIHGSTVVVEGAAGVGTAGFVVFNVSRSLQWSLASDGGGLALVDALDLPSGDVLALACDDSSCRILSGAVDSSTLTEGPIDPLPQGFRPRGLAFDERTQQLCAFGDGLACERDGTPWAWEISRGQGIEIRSVDFSYPVGDTVGVAVGDAGVAYVRHLDGSGNPLIWERVPSVTSHSITAVGAFGPSAEMAVMTDASGLWLFLQSSQLTMSCKGDAQQLGIAATAQGDYYTVTADGRIRMHRFDSSRNEQCEFSTRVTAPVGVSTWECYASPEVPLVLTPNAVLGLGGCSQGG